MIIKIESTNNLSRRHTLLKSEYDQEPTFVSRRSIRGRLSAIVAMGKNPININNTFQLVLNLSNVTLKLKLFSMNPFYVLFVL